MNKFKILVEGFAKKGENDNFFASPTTTVIWSGDKIVLVDPGAHSTMLLDSMKRESIAVDDVDIVYLTHYHPDHFLNIRLFPNAQIMDGETHWLDNSEERFHEGTIIPGTDIVIIKTPGHASEHTSLLIEDSEKGIVCVAQDVFWWKDGQQKTDSYEDMIEQEDEFASDTEALKKSRKKVLEVADYIIPGHGKMFKNTHKQ